MLSQEQCLDYAVQCERLASLEHRPGDRERLIALARRWSELARASRTEPESDRS